MTSWRVDSFHIGLGTVGDGAIHLAVESSINTASVVRWAMLVDGGNSGGELRIANTIAWIQSQSNRYDLKEHNPDGVQILTFDAVVITHWDTDHWTGVINAIKADVLTQVQGGTPVQDLKVSFFRYGPGTPRIPLTILYCPEVGYLFKNSARFGKKPADAKPVGTDFICPSGVVKNVCLIRMEPKLAGTVTTLGTNLVEGKDLTVAPKDVTSPVELVNDNSPSTPGKPGIYIVAASARVIGLEPDTFVVSPEDAVRLLNDVGVVDENKPGTPTNKSSIACMILWKQQQPTDAPRISHYFGGDMHWQEEDALVSWSGVTGDRTKVGTFVTTMKFSHHGAKSSTPTEMLKLFNPYNLVASVGERNGHPSWELIFYIEGWMWAGGLGQSSYRPLLSTQFPYYLAREKNAADEITWVKLPGGSANQMSMKVLSGKDPASTNYKQAITDIFTEAGAPLLLASGKTLENPFQEWDNQMDKSDTAAKDWARTRIADAWPRLSPVPPTAHPAMGASRATGNNEPIHESKMLSFFLIQSKDDSQKDGVVYVKYDSSTSLRQLRPDYSAIPSNPTGQLFAASPVLGIQPTISPYPSAVSNTDPATGKRKRKAQDASVHVTKKAKTHLQAGSSPSDDSVYLPSGGTNPNENDSMMDDVNEALDIPDPDQESDSDSDSDGDMPIMDPQPDPGMPEIPGEPATGPPPLQEPYYFVCASNVRYDTPPGQDVKQLKTTDPLNNFLSTFHLSGLILAGIPEPKEQTLLHKQDEFQEWLSKSLAPGASDPDAVQMSVTTDPNDGAYITQFDLTVPLLGGSQYSSSDTNSQLGTLSWGLGPAGTVPWQNSLILGLSNAKQATGLKLADILQPVTSPAVPQNLSVLLQVLGDILVFNVDTDPTTNPGSRNAIWFDGSAAYQTLVRTQYVASPDSVQKMNSWIGEILTGFSIQSLVIVTKSESTWVSTSEQVGAINKWEILFNTTCKIGKDPNKPISVEPSVTFDFNDTILTITLQFNYTDAASASSLLGDILDWVTSQGPLKNAEFNFSEWIDRAGSNFEAPMLRRMVLVLELDKDGGFPKTIDNFSIDLELGLKFGQPGGNTPQQVVFLFTYQWAQGLGSSLQGSLWCPPPPDGDVNRQVLPDYESFLQFEPASVQPGEEWAATLDLANLIPSDPSSGQSGGTITHVPDGIPTEVTLAVLRLDQNGISFTAAIECNPPDSTDIPKLFLSRIGLNASYTYKPSGFAIGFDFAATMFPQAQSGIIPIELVGGVQYDKGSWSVSAAVESPGMQGAHFLEFFEKDSGPTATALIQHIALNFLRLDYRYTNGSGDTNPAKSFTFSGSMSIGKLDLTVDFNYTGPNTWTFVANIDTTGGEPCTIQEILDSIIGDKTVDIPSCVGDIKVGSQSSESSGIAETGLFNLTITKLKADSEVTDADGQDIVCTVSVNIGPVAFTFLQFRNTLWPVEKRPSKRFFRLEAKKIPDIDIPIIGNLSQPFQEMYFMWVQDGNPDATATSPPGFTKAEIEALNTGVLKDDPIYYKLTKAENDYKDTDVLVEAGCHFVLVVKEKGASKVVLDYVFAKPTPGSKKVPPPALALQRHARLKALLGPDAVMRTERSARTDNVLARSRKNTVQNDADAGSGTKKTAFKVSIGPFSISNIGLKFSDSVLSVCLDAAVAIGPIAMELMGFSINLDFGHGHNLSTNFPTPEDGMSFSLQGMAASFDRPPLTIAGGLVHQLTDNGDFWAGGVDIKFVPWSFLAAGAYGQMTDPKTKNPFTTTFVFAKLTGPLITLEFATIEGVTGGFGYNNALKLPTVAEVPRFPLIAVPSPATPSTGNATMDMLTALFASEWFTPQDASFWVAAGLTVTAFEMLQITAVAVAEWDPAVRLGIYAVAVADVPSTKAPFKVAHVELGILASVDFSKGIAAFEAQLAPSSFILDPMCHLSGGFALYYWFKDGSDQRDGDWVFTLGGYHALYKAPPQYPQPPRLKIEWSLGPLSVIGQAYFAITPNACMAGASLHASLSIGVLSAFLDAYADFLINYKPFSFKAGGGVSVGVRFTLDLLFVTIHINIEISATLTLLGPPFQGTAYVDFWVFGFTIHFGDSRPPVIQPASLEEFYHLTLQKDSPTASTSPPVPHKFMCQSGLIPSTPSSPAARRARIRAATSVARVIDLEEEEGEEVAVDNAVIWQVHAGTLNFSISSVFAISNVVVYPDPDSPHPINLPAPKPDTVDIYSRPMYLTAGNAMVSTLNVWVHLTNSDVEPQWELRPVIQQVPRALWDAYDPNTDPNNGSNALLDAKNSPTVPLMMGVLFLPPPPRLSIENIKPFDAIASQLQDVFDKPPPFLDSTTSANAAWLPATPTPPPPTDPAQPWEIIQALWDTPKLGPGTAATAVEKWVSCMGWNTGSVSGAVPARLVEELQNTYVAAPMVAAAA